MAETDSYLLTAQERDRFATWLERQAETSKGIILQLEKLGPQSEIFIKKEKLELLAYETLARKLRTTEDG